MRVEIILGDAVTPVDVDGELDADLVFEVDTVADPVVVEDGHVDIVVVEDGHEDEVNDTERVF